MDQERFFLLDRGELDHRFDPEYYHPERRTAIEKIQRSTNDVLHLKYVVKFPKVIVSQAANALPYISLEDIEANTGQYLNVSGKTTFGTALLFGRNDILFPKLRPYLNKVHIASFDGVCSTEFVPLRTRSVLPKFLAAFLSSDAVVKQTKHMMSGNTLPRLQTEDINNLLIPICNEDVQVKVQEIYEDALVKKEEKEGEAKRTLKSMDDFTLKELGVALPSQLTNNIQNRIFKTGWQKATGNRLDPSYYQNFYDDWMNSFRKSVVCKPLRHVTTRICLGRTPSKDEYAKEGNIIVKAGSLKNSKVNWSTTAFTNKRLLSKRLEDGDILLLSAAHQISYIGKNPSIVEIPEHLKGLNIYFVGELLCISPDKNEINPYYLLSILNMNCYYHLINRETRGQTSHLYPSDMLHLQIPVPEPGIQNRIGDEFKRRLTRSKQLNDEAKLDFQQAKKEIEKLILE